MKSIDLTTPRHEQPTVLTITRLKPEVLQTWVNRSAIKLQQQNPGSGRRRLYSDIDVVKLAIMRRLADFRIDLSVSREIAEAVEAELKTKGKWSWDEYLFIRRDDATAKDVKIEVIRASGMSPLTKFRSTYCDPAKMCIADIIEPDGSIFERREKSGNDRRGPIDESKRESWAREGVHAEPSLVFPLGEIINGTLLQLDAVSARYSTDAGSRTA